jgi:hypothetical protein
MGKFQPAAEMWAGCKGCATGWYSDNAVAAKMCPAGKFQSTANASACDDCKTGGEGCLMGKIRVGCKDPGLANDTTTCEGGCTAGFYGKALDGIEDVFCHSWHNADESKAMCGVPDTCGAGSAWLCTEVDPVAKVECHACPRGYAQPLAGEKDCSACMAGRFAAERAAAHCTKCAAGKWSVPISTICAACSPGKYGDGESTKKECESCPTGRYANLRSARECTTCPAGRYTSTIGATSCDACRSGQFGDSSRPHESCHECEACPTSKYANLQGARECTTCTVGRYASTINSTSCDACISGQFGNSSRPQGSADAQPGNVLQV